jgi:hypothetical protein
MPIKLPSGDPAIAPIDNTLVDLIQRIANNDPNRDMSIHAVIVLKSTPGHAGDPTLYIDVNQSGCSEIVSADPVQGYPSISPVTVHRLDYASAMIYRAVTPAGAALAASSCWYVVGGQRFHCR